MNENRIIYLHAQYINQQLTKEELAEWQLVINSPQYHALLKVLMKETWENLKQDGIEDMPKPHADEILSTIIGVKQLKSPQKLWLQRIAVAASIAITVVAGALLYNNNLKSNAVHQQQLAQKNIAPGINGATLTLSTGKKIKLTDAVNGQLAQETGISITKARDGQLVYQVTGDKGATDKINELSTANGETYRVRLPDGSEVWLNAASSIKYPANFTGSTERRVELIGEAYFEVAKDKSRPFIVNSGTQEVKVLGTHFNINNYAEQQFIKTSLLEGSVQVSSLQTGQSSNLKPGQAAKFDGQTIHVANVDTEEAVAWKNGYFHFSGKTLEEAMREVGRWYNVEVVYKNKKLKSLPLAGTISKYEKVLTVLKTMELAGAIDFTIENRTIIIK